MKKRILSLLLTLALLVLPVVSAGAAQPDPTLVQTQTEAAEAAQHQYSYIALGDSIVAGIGLPDAVYQRNGRYYDVSGNYQGYSKDCYVARVAEGLGLSRDQTANYGMPALMSGDLLELVRTGSCQSASINFQELKALNPDAQIVLVGYYNPVPLLPAPANPFVKHFRTLNRSVQKLAQQYDVAFASAAYTRVADALGLDRDHAVNYGMPAAMSSNILDLVRTGSTASGVRLL